MTRLLQSTINGGHIVEHVGSLPTLLVALVLRQIKNGTGRGGGVCVWRPWR